MSYQEALEAAGAVVHRFEVYGSYQGEWMAHVTLPDGKTGFIIDYYGSCSGCDSFEGSEPGWHQGPDEEYHSGGEHPETCEECGKYAGWLKGFGEGYFAQILDREAALAYCDEHDWGDYAEMKQHILSITPPPEGANE